MDDKQDAAPAAGAGSSGTSLSRRWKAVPRQKKGLAFLFVGLATIVALAVGISLITKEKVYNQGSSSAPENNQDLTSCDAYQPNDPSSPFVFQFEGVGCYECNKDLGTLYLSECNSSCTDWVLDYQNSDFHGVLDTCEIINNPTPQPTGYGYQCPDGYYVTYAETGCVVDTVDEFVLFQQECYLLGDPDTTLDECFATCETKFCYAVMVAEDGTGCFAITENVASLCNYPQQGSTMCKKIPSSYECFDAEETYQDGKGKCDDQGYHIVTGDDAYSQYRASEECNSPKGCYIGTPDSFGTCTYVTPGTYDVVPASDCSEPRGYCCETPTDAPTQSPTSSPTLGLFYVPKYNETEWQDADDICKYYGGELAAIHNTDEQAFAWEICEKYIDAYNNPCGCWIGLNRIGHPSSVPPQATDFFWSDLSDFTFNGFEPGQPDNKGFGERDNECVHMRPFKGGYWNDLPCGGFCDATDHQPIPLCRLITDSPTTSPTLSPTHSPTNSPTKAPTSSPTYSPSKSPTKEPTTSPTRSPTLSPSTHPTYSPTDSPTKEPTASPTYSPSKSPTDSPTVSPTQSPTDSPTKAPTSSPTYSPSKSPTDSPTKSPTQSPTKNPTRSPSTTPTDSPTKEPTGSPTQSPTKNPTQSPTKAPTDSPTQHPTYSPSKAPTDSPTYSPSKSPTKAPTYSPSQSPTSSPSVSPTSSPTYSPSTSPTKNPTLSPSTSPTLSPSVSPTYSPFAPPTPPEPSCLYDSNEYVWSVNNPSVYTVPYTYMFLNPVYPKVLRAKRGFYDTCAMPWCVSITADLSPGETYYFSAPTNKVTALYPCKPDLSLCLEEYTAPGSIGECQCNHTQFFFDDFNDYPIGNEQTPQNNPTFYDTWNVRNNGTIDIIGFITVNGDQIVSSDFELNPCKDQSSCVDIDGTMYTDPKDTELDLNDDEVILEPSNSFYQRLCTMNFWASGNRRCGVDHPFPRSQRLKFGCAAYYGGNHVPLFDNLTAGIRDGDGNELARVLYEDIAWNQSFEPYAITIQAPYNGSIEGFFNVTAGVRLQTGGNIGPLLDDVDVTCCCPSPDDKYVERVVGYEQGPTGNYTPVPLGKSDPAAILGAGPKVPAYPQVYALGIGGWVVYEFSLGVSEYVTIYEESHDTCLHCYYEDASVEVSVDGIVWETVLYSFNGLWQIYAEHQYDDSVRYVTIPLPRGACFKYIRLVDHSVPECDASDGFDLVAIVVGEPCCPHIYPPLQLGSAGGETSGFEFITKVPGAAAFLFLVAAVGAVGLLGMASLTVRHNNEASADRKMSILEPAGIDVEEFKAEVKERKRSMAAEDKDKLPVVPKMPVLEDPASSAMSL